MAAGKVECSPEQVQQLLAPLQGGRLALAIAISTRALLTP
jgi:hypothetical protein